MNQNDIAHVLDLLRLSMDEREELDARRLAAEHHLVVNTRAGSDVPFCPMIERMHIIAAREWRCILVLDSWASVRAFLARLRAGVLTNLIMDAPECNVHPRLPPAGRRRATPRTRGRRGR
jgi:hypothetical protein